MSHYSVIVALPPGCNVEDELDKRLAPFDENMTVEPHRDYESAETPEDFWWYKSIKGDAEVVAKQDHSKILPYEPDGIGISSAYSHKTPEQQWVDYESDAALFNSLPNPPTWQSVCDAYNERWEHTEYDEDGELDGSYMHYDPEKDRAYTMSTYNPNSKWDYWRIGGRWPRYFPVRSEVNLWHPAIIQTRLSWEWKPTPGLKESKPDQDARARLQENWVEGGPKRLLNFDIKRDFEAGMVRKDYAEFMAFVEETGFSLEATKGWSEFTTEFMEIDSSKDKWAIRSRAREVYAAQPLVAAMNESEEYKFAWDCLIDRYKKNSLEELIRVARRDAVPGYAVLTLEGEWKAPGEMGWFGMSSDDDEARAQYKDWANDYLDGLPGDTILVVLDVHI